MLRVALVDFENALPRYAAAGPSLPSVQWAGVVGATVSDAAHLQTIGAPAQYASLTDLLAADADIDAVILHAPPPQCGELATCALARGKHVLATTPCPGRADLSETVCRWMRPLRSMPFGKTLKTRLESGELGKPGLVRVHHWRGAAVDGSATTLPALLLHELDLAIWLFAEKPETVVAVGHGSPDACAVAQVHLGFPEGGMAIVDGLRSENHNASAYLSASVIGSCGAAYADDHRNINLLYTPNRTTALGIDQGTEHLAGELAALIAAISAPQQVPEFDAHGKIATAVAEAAAASWESGRAAHWTGEGYELR